MHVISGRHSARVGVIERKAVAAEFGVTPRTVRNWEAAGDFPRSKKVGRGWYYRLDEVRAFVAARAA